MGCDYKAECSVMLIDIFEQAQLFGSLQLVHPIIWVYIHPAPEVAWLCNMISMALIFSLLEEQKCQKNPYFAFILTISKF